MIKKGLLLLLVSSFVLTSSFIGYSEEKAPTSSKLEGTISMSGAWALYPMAVRWADEFKKENPNIKFDISAGGAGKGMSDALAGIVDIGMLSREIYPQEIEKGAYPIAVTKDAVVPVINEKNPFLNTILKTGMTRQNFIDLWIDNKITKWSQIYSDISDKDTSVNIFTRSDSCGAAETWAAYLGKKQENLNGTGIYGDPGIAEAVKKDVLGIGYNNVNYAYDSKTKKPVLGLQIVPIDINNNGKIDKEEDFYKDRDTLVEAIAKGIYPSPPARDLYFVTKGKPEKEIVKLFINWVLTDGQKFVPEAGYINLAKDKIEAELDKIKK